MARTGDTDGAGVGATVGVVLRNEGDTLGIKEGSRVGSSVGMKVGGNVTGNLDGWKDGTCKQMGDGAIEIWNAKFNFGLRPGWGEVSVQHLAMRWGWGSASCLGPAKARS